MAAVDIFACDIERSPAGNPVKEQGKLALDKRGFVTVM
jgi:hypothetical protein